MKNVIDPMLEELESELNPVRKQMLLQKYGLIEPKLTPDEAAYMLGYDLAGIVENAAKIREAAELLSLRVI